MKRRYVAIIILLLFVGTCIFPAVAMISEKPLLLTRERWLYVGGSGPGNYTIIQDAIDNASDGDTVYVYSGLYESNVNIQKSINLRGENRTDTIIDVQWQINAVALVKGNINISGFTIRHASFSGLFVVEGTHNISDNIITQNEAGIIMWGGTDCVIYGNTIQWNNRSGIENQYSKNTRYTQNILMNNPIGFYNEGPYLQTCERNSFQGNTEGFEYQLNSQNKMLSNNFLQNKNDTNIINPGFNLFFQFSDFLGFLLWSHVTKWDNNYWDKWQKTTPKPIGGFFIVYIEFFNLTESCYLDTTRNIPCH